MSFAYMKLLESRPSRYDTGMAILTLGALTKLKRQVATHARTGTECLDLGCGTGTLAEMCIERGALVTGVDADVGMLEVARKCSPSTEYLNIDLSNLEEHLQGRSFDLVASTLAFSELTKVERLHVLRQVKGLLKPGGTLFIGDETVPGMFAAKCLYYSLRLPAQVLAWLVSQTTTTAITDLDDDIQEVGMRIVSRKSYLCGCLMLLEIQ